MCDEGICRPSKSPWSSPLHLVKKSDGTWRPCGDYRALNKVTIPDRYPVPHLTDFNSSLAGTCIYSKIDLVKAFYHVPVNEPDIPKTAVITPFGLFEFLKMPFGLRNSPQTFQRFMHNILREVPFAFCYLDDILIASKSQLEHEQHLTTIFEVLKKYGLTVNSAKSEYGVDEIDFLGYKVSSKGITPQPGRVKALLDFPQPKEVQELRRFLGLINFYRRCLPNTANTQDILYKLIPDNRKKDQRQIQWTAAAQDAFNKLKKDLSEAALLAHPTHGPMYISVDASQTAIGGSLEQKQSHFIVPLSFFSRSRTPPQQKYSTYDRELLAIYQAIRYFRPLVEGRELTIFTDHRPLTTVFSQSLDKASPRQFRYLDYIGQFTTDIRYVPGSDNVAADTFSRAPITISALDLTDNNFFIELAQAQEADSELQNIRTGKTSLKLRDVPIFGSSHKLTCDYSTSQDRPYVPQAFRKSIFNVLHDQSHPGIRATVKLITTRYVWPSIRKDVAQWARSCLQCQRCKIHRHSVTPLHKFSIPAARFLNIHIDIVGPLSPSQSCRYLLTMVDRYTRWIEAVPLPEITAPIVAEAFYREWIARYGVPATVVTDQGRQFESMLFQELGRLCGFKRHRTTAYHPQSNGLVERFHRTLKTALTASLLQTRQTWTIALPSILLSLRTLVKEDLGTSPCELVYGQGIRLPSDFFQTSSPPPQSELLQKLKEHMNSCRPVPPRAAKAKSSYIHKDLRTTSHVFIRVDAVRPPLTPPYEGPYKIISREDKYFIVEKTGRSMTVSIDRLKPCHDFAPSHDLEHSSSPATPPTPMDIVKPTITRSGRKVHFPARLP